MTKRILRETLEKIKELGACVDKVEYGSKHIKIFLSCNGAKMIAIRSKSPSDNRGNMNFFSMVRKWVIDNKKI